MPSTDEASRAFLQVRVALFGKVMSGISLAGIAAHVVSAMAFEGDFEAAPLVLSTGTGISSLAVWLSCRKGERSARFCRAAESTALIASITLVMIMGRFLVPLTLTSSIGVDPASAAPGALHDETLLAQILVLMSLLIGSTHACVVRAALVPSPPWYTAAITGSVVLPMAILYGYGVVPTAAESIISAHTTLVDRHATVLQGALWWCFTVAVCTVISRVIYGLHREIREAQKLGQYTLEEKLGEGGMGVVYRARHALMRRPTAVKLLADDKQGDESLVRFEREVRLTARLTHPNTITVFDYGHTPDGIFYYAMELLDGANLEEVVDLDGPMPASRVAAILVQVGGALEEAHGVGLIHRDIKPQNIYLCSRGGIPDVAKLLDFGLVKDVKGAKDASVTQEGSISGTPLYMSPETVTTPDAVGARSDLYSLGAVAWFLLTGEHVFKGRTPVEVLGHHLHTEPTRPSLEVEREIPEALEAIVMECLSKNPEDRPESARALVDRVRQTGLAEGWDRDAAESWWREHGEPLRRKTGRPPASQKTLEVDFGERSALAS